MAAAQLKLKWACISNSYRDDDFLAELTIRNAGADALDASGWALYFNTARKIKTGSVSAGVAIEHVNGDLFRLLPQAGFSGLPPGASCVVTYEGLPWAISETDAPLGFYLVYQPGTDAAQAMAIGDPEIAPFERPQQRHRSRTDQLPLMTPARRYDDNAAVHALPAAEVGRITPAPLHAQADDGYCAIDGGTVVMHGRDLDSEAAYLRALLAALPAKPDGFGAGGPRISLQIGAVALEAGDDAVQEEAYRLTIGVDGIAIVGASAHGVFNGIQTLRALLPVAGKADVMCVPCMRIVDAPRFAYRGMMLDVARHFSGKETVLRLLDCMARYKLNRFHFHATDDEGWRLEIAGLPELTGIGSRRGFSADDRGCLLPSFGSGAEVAGSAGTGYYSRADFIEILRFATQRHIDVIPEFNLPGHSRAAIMAMRARFERLSQAGDIAGAHEYLLNDPDDASSYESVQLWHDNVICIALPSCYRFIETVVADVVAMYGEAGAPLSVIHSGGDEVPSGAWSASPKCAALMRERGWSGIAQLHDDFLARYRDILRRHGLTFAGWEEIATLHETAGVDAATLTPNPKFAGAGFRAYVWNSAWGSGHEDFAYRLANAGYPVVLANASNLYFDLAYAKDPQEPGYYWAGFVETRDAFTFCPLDIYATATLDQMGAPLEIDQLARMTRLTDAGRANVLGMQGQLWGENARTRERVEYLAMPRLIALAERAWSRDPAWSAIADVAARRGAMALAWNEFTNRLGLYELPRIDAEPDAYGYRIAPPGVKLAGGALHVNSWPPGLALHYTLDGTEPSDASTPYLRALPVAKGQAATFKIAAFNSAGRKSRTVTITLDNET